jgi:hypothetical protein
MIEFAFTLDYEIYGNGKGSLKDLAYEPAESLRLLFDRYDAPLVVFAEAAELEAIESAGTDPSIHEVKKQLRILASGGHEIGIHLHPQWFNARFESGDWQLDYGEYNLCVLPPDRIRQYIGQSIEYLRRALDDPDFVPVSFRAGNWLLQPTKTVARELAGHGVKIDSSVYKGGIQSRHGLDYRRSLKNGYYWMFSDDVNVPDKDGLLIEIPTYTKMVPLWSMFSSKRLELQMTSAAKGQQKGRWQRIKDLLRPKYPMKLDFCRLEFEQVKDMLDREIGKDRDNPGEYRPIVSIGHSKDLRDLETVEAILAYLREKGIPVTTFQGSYLSGRWPN